VCEEKNKTIKKGSEKFISSAGLVAKVCYLIGAAGVDRLSRKGKIRQATKNIDDLFAEVCYLSIDPSTQTLSGLTRELCDRLNL